MVDNIWMVARMNRFYLVLLTAFIAACDEEKTVVQEEETFFVDNDGDGFPFRKIVMMEPAITPAAEESLPGCGQRLRWSDR